MKDMFNSLGEKIIDGLFGLLAEVSAKPNMTLEEVIEFGKEISVTNDIVQVIDADTFWIITFDFDEGDDFICIDKETGKELNYDDTDSDSMDESLFKVVWLEGEYVTDQSTEQSRKKKIQYICSCEEPYFEIGMGANGNVFFRNKYTEIPNIFRMYDQEEVNKIFSDLCEKLYKKNPVVKTYGDNKKRYVDVLYTDGTEAAYENPGLIELYKYSEFNGNSAFAYGEYSEYATIARLKQVCRDKQENFNIFKQVIEDIEIGTDEYEKLVVTDLPNSAVSLEVIILQGNICHERITINPYGYIDEAGKSKYAELLKKYQVRIIK